MKWVVTIYQEDGTRYQCANCGWIIPVEGDDELFDWYENHTRQENV